MTTEIEKASDYSRFRGRCKDLVDEAVSKDPTLTAVRGHYFCPLWNREDQHWWAVRPDGTILDPSVCQFPSKGFGIYTPFDGMVTCSECGKTMEEDDAAKISGKYAFCTEVCYGRFVGVLK